MTQEKLIQKSYIGIKCMAAVVGAFFMLAPFLWMFSMSFRRPIDAYNMPPDYLPESFNLENYVALFSSSLPIIDFFINSFVIAISVTLAQLVTCSTAAFGFARLRFPGRDFLFYLVLIGMMVPVQVTIIPLFIGISKIQLTDSVFAIILPLLVNSFGVFLVCEFFRGHPKDLEDAAKIDGAGYWTIFWKIALPQSKPVLAALAIFTYTTTWNLYFQPLVFLNNWENFTLPLGISMLTGYMSGENLSVVMAGVTVSVLPVFIIFLIAQKHIIQGMTFSGLKG